ncbi:hypothetical protein PMAYCL1PPCAC_11452, partial [Pristionchus mayeri]
IDFYNALQSRIHMIEFMKSNRTYSDFLEISDIAEKMKAKMIENIESTKWLHGDEIGDFIREKTKERIASIQIYHDFDEHDQNMTYISKVNHDFNELYFSNQRKSGILALDTLLGLRYAFKEIEKRTKNTTEIFVERIRQNFVFNAFFELISTTVTILAPLMHRESFTSEILKEPFITYSILGHELYHSLFPSTSPILSTLFTDRGKCVIKHYEQSCSKFAMGACKSGNQTFNEDSPDLESFRLLHSILREKYIDRELNEKIEGMETTLEQAFFYYTASATCEADENRTDERAKKDSHSAWNIRINAAFSFMPEFSKAFGCKEGDQMFIKEEQSCYVFGPNS